MPTVVWCQRRALGVRRVTPAEWAKQRETAVVQELTRALDLRRRAMEARARLALALKATEGAEAEIAELERSGEEWATAEAKRLRVRLAEEQAGLEAELRRALDAGRRAEDEAAHWQGRANALKFVGEKAPEDPPSQ